MSRSSEFSGGPRSLPAPQQITFNWELSPSAEWSRDFRWDESLSAGKTCIHCWFQRYSRYRNAKIHLLEDARNTIRPGRKGHSQAEKAAVALYGLATGTQRWAKPETIDNMARHLNLSSHIINAFRILSEYYQHQFLRVDHNNQQAEKNCGLVIKLDRGTHPDRPSWTHLSYLYHPAEDRLILTQVERINEDKIAQFVRGYRPEFYEH